LSDWENFRVKFKTLLPPTPLFGENDKIRGIRAWANPLFQVINGSNINSGDLSRKGMKEEYCLAERIRQHFPDLFREPYSPYNYDFHATYITRAIERYEKYRCIVCPCGILN